MARPPHADAEATQRRILDAAERRFGLEGLAGVSVREVAKDAGVTFATVHHYFGTKQDLFDRCLERGFAQLQGLQEQMQAELAAVMSGPFSLPDLLRRAARCALRFGLSHKETSRFLLRAAVFELDAPNRARIETSQQNFLNVASQALAPLLGREPADLRVPLQGLMFLITRMAVTSDRELQIISGGQIDVLAQMEAYAGDVAVATLLGPNPTSTTGTPS